MPPTDPSSNRRDGRKPGVIDGSALLFRGTFHKAYAVCSTHAGEYLLLYLARAPMRNSRRPDAGMRLRAQRDRSLPEAYQRSPARPHQHPCRSVAVEYEKLTGKDEAEPSAQPLLCAAAQRLQLSARAFRVLKLARTIADLAESEKIAAPRIAGALQYRPRVEWGEGARQRGVVSDLSVTVESV